MNAAYNPIEEGMSEEYYIVVGRANQVSKNGNHYASLKITAKKGEVYDVCVWDMDEAAGPGVGDIVRVDMTKIKGIKYPKMEDFNGFAGCRPSEPFDDLYELLPRPESFVVWKNVIDDLLEWCEDGSLKEFIKRQIGELYELYKDKAAATSIHHAYKGGLLNHTFDMLRMLNALVPTLPELKVEYCAIAIMFHDYGKIFEYNDKLEPMESMYLYGHIYLSAAELERRLYSEGIPNKDVVRIVHCVLAHHGKQEWGSPVVPCTMEA